MTRVIGYIDGFNMYYGLKQRNWRQFYWLDPHKLVASLLSPDHDLVGVKYFTANVRGKSAKRNRHAAFLDAVRAHSDCEIILGKYLFQKRSCQYCLREYMHPEEKMTDCAIVANMVADAFLDRFDMAIVLGGDTDLIPGIKMIRRHFPKKRTVAWFPPKRKNQAVADTCDDEGGMIDGSHLSTARMPREVKVAPGVIIRRPQEWDTNSPSAVPGGSSAGG